MLIFKYQTPSSELVKCNRLMLAILMIAALFLENIYLVYAFAVVNLITVFTGVKYSPSSWIYFLFKNLLHVNICHVNDLYKRSYQMSQDTESFEVFLRVAVALLAIGLYEVEPFISWLIVIFMAIFMLISSFFGFCLAALGYVLYKYIIGMFSGKR